MLGEDDFNSPLRTCQSQAETDSSIMLLSNEQLLVKAKSVMRKLKYGLEAAKFRIYIDLRTIATNKTRWSSEFEKVKRYTELRSCMDDGDDSDVDFIFPTASENRAIDSIEDILRQLDELTRELQFADTNISDTRIAFSVLTEHFPEVKRHLKADAAILHSPDFELSVSLIRNRKVSVSLRSSVPQSRS